MALRPFVATAPDRRADPLDMFSRLGMLVSELGFTDAGLYLLARATAKTSRGTLRVVKFYLVAQPVRQDELTPPRRGRSIVVQEADAETIRGTEFGRPAPVIEYRLAHQCRCLLARKDEHLLGFQWFSTQDYPEDEVRCLYRLEPGDRCAWDFDIYVHPEARALPTFLRLWDHCNMLLRQAGIEQSLSRIDAFNSASRRSHARLGARTIGWAVFLCAGPAQLALFSGRPWVHVSMSKGHTPQWRVSRLARQRNST
jgi:hypothetical protein